MRFSKAFIKLSLRAARVHGEPLPKGLIAVGGPKGWSFALNATTEDIDRIPAHTAIVEFDGTVCGIIAIDGGALISRCDIGATEDAFIALCESDLEVPK